MKFLIKTAIIIICVLALGYVFYFKKDSLKRVGERAEKWITTKIHTLSGSEKEREAENKLKRMIEKEKVEEDISEKDRKQLERIIEEKGK